MLAKRSKSKVPKKSASVSKSIMNAKNSPTTRSLPEDTARHSCLSQSIVDYGRALANPFSGPLVGVPSYPSCLSLKAKAWCKGTFQTSTTGSGAGFGYIVVSPNKLCFNNRVGVSSSFNTLANPNIPADPSAPTVGTRQQNSNSMYSDTLVGSLPGSLQYRVVACGLRIRYIGTELDRGGYIVGLMDPTHSSLGSSTEASFNAEVQSVRFAVEREWVTVLWRPVVDTEFAYSTTQPVSTDFPMGFIVQAASASTSLAYEYETFVLAEYQGATVRGQTATAHDPVGFAAANYVMQTSKLLQPSMSAPPQREGTVIGEMAKYVAHGISGAVNAPAGQVRKQITDGSSSSSSGSWSSYLWNGIKAAVPVGLSLLPAL